MILEKCNYAPHSKYWGPKVIHWFRIPFFKKCLLWEVKGFGIFDHTNSYVLLHCEITKNDENLNKPISEIRMIEQTGGIVIFSKSGCIRDLDIKLPNFWRWIMIFPIFDQFWGLRLKWFLVKMVYSWAIPASVSHNATNFKITCWKFS